ncbi:hypothetical protein RJT17_35890 [Streptomyces sp. P5-A9]|uniref:hypothetical protein n=1 Tax=Streptomyces sp. P5-A9 TaxID=3071730 RepID=UPI002FCB13FC
MSLGDEPNNGGRGRSLPGESADANEMEPADATAEQPPHFSVVISGDGSATINGEPIPTAEGVTVDAAILDVLHGFASDRMTNVTAIIADPSAEFAALVEVAPDGSSVLLEQSEPAGMSPVSAEKHPAPAGEYQELDEKSSRMAEEASHTEHSEPARLDWSSEAEDDLYVPDNRNNDHNDDFDDDFDEVADELDEGTRSKTSYMPAALGRWRGPKSDRKREPRQSGDEYEQSKLLNKPLFVGPMALVAAAIIIVPLLILGSSESDSGGEDRKNAAGASSETETPDPDSETPPTVSVSPSAPPPPPSPTATKSPAEPKKSKAADQGTGGTVKPEPTQDTRVGTPARKSSQDTAAVAVNRLARSDPSGRHVCYRAYVTGQGWQKPVCDGKTAGTSGQNRPIKALNIAVRGVGGSAASAFTSKTGSTDGRGEWNKWTAVVGDGRDNYIGSTERTAPNMLGFAINIGKGRLCHVAALRNSKGGNRACTEPRPDFTFGGSLLNSTWLESVQFTV